MTFVRRKHEWVAGVCRWCAMRAQWAGASRPCEAACAATRHAGEARHKVRAAALRMLRGTNEEARDVDASRASVTGTDGELQ